MVLILELRQLDIMQDDGRRELLCIKVFFSIAYFYPV